MLLKFINVLHDDGSKVGEDGTIAQSDTNQQFSAVKDVAGAAAAAAEVEEVDVGSVDCREAYETLKTILPADWQRKCGLQQARHLKDEKFVWICAKCAERAEELGVELTKLPET